MNLERGVGRQLEACTQPERAPTPTRPLLYREGCRACLVALVAFALQDPLHDVGEVTSFGFHAFAYPPDAALRMLRGACDEFDALRVRAEPLLAERGARLD